MLSSVRPRSASETSSTKATATSPATNRRRKASSCVDGVAPRRSTSATLHRSDARAGSDPQMHAHANAAIATTPITRQLTATSRFATAPNCSNARRSTAGVSHNASSTPPAVPAATSAAASSSNCLAISERRAPSAHLTASSRRRSIDRTIKSPATLVKAMSIASAAAPARRPSVLRLSPAIAVATGVATTRAGGEEVRLTSSSAAAKFDGEELAARRAIASTR